MHSLNVTRTSLILSYFLLQKWLHINLRTWSYSSLPAAKLNSQVSSFFLSATIEIAARTSIQTLIAAAKWQYKQPLECTQFLKHERLTEEEEAHAHLEAIWDHCTEVKDDDLVSMEAEVGEKIAMTAPPCAKQAPGESKTNHRNFLKNKPRCKRICYLSVSLSVWSLFTMQLVLSSIP